MYPGKNLKRDMTEALQFLKIETEAFPSVQEWFFCQFLTSNQSRMIFLVGKLLEFSAYFSLIIR